jgi:5-methylcytosine-specific restriction endonuclease McrA
MKHCRVCGELKPLAAFHRKSDAKDGVMSTCKVCRSAEATEQYKTDKRKLLTAKRAYEENPDLLRARQRLYRERDPARSKDTQRRYRDKNRDSLNASGAEYRSANPEKVRAASQRMRAMRKGAPGSHTSDDIKALFASQRGLCVACRASIKGGYHVDHTMPLSRGGTNDKTNLQLLCPTCNLSKNARDPIEFMNQRGFLL